MNEDLRQHSTVRLPILIDRPVRRAAPWHARLDADLTPSATAWRTPGTSAAEARQALAQLFTAALIRMEQGPIVVIGGSEQYASCLHLILPESHGWVVAVLRDGRHATTWSSGHDREEVLRQVLDHVGGQPAVISF